MTSWSPPPMADDCVEYRLYFDWIDVYTLKILSSSATVASNGGRNRNSGPPVTVADGALARERAAPSDSPVLQRLEERRREILAQLERWTKGYIWQKERFDLQIWPGGADPTTPAAPSSSLMLPTSKGPHKSRDKGIRNQLQDEETAKDVDAPFLSFAPCPHLFGKTVFGDNILDEWFIVFLLFQISQKYPDTTIRVVDSDGQFLLIEAAEAIPRWMKPENSEHRLFIRGGRVHIIPRPRTPAELPLIPTTLDASAALSYVQQQHQKTVAKDAIQNAIQKRLQTMPDEALEANRHQIRAILPRSVARVLLAAPELVSPAVEAFYLRDALDLRVCRKMERFLARQSMSTASPDATALADANVPQSPTTTDFVNVSVRLTRCLYAQLQNQKFHAPKCFRLPPMPPLDDDSKAAKEKWHALDLGVKLSCGLEILYQRGKQKILRQQQRQQKGAVFANSTETATLKDIIAEDNPAWLAYKQALSNRGFFGDFIEGSKPYRERETIAKRAFLQYCESRGALPKLEELTQREDHKNVALVELMEQILGAPETESERRQLRAEFFSLPPSDQDSWMYLSPADLDEMLKARNVTDQTEAKEPPVDKDPVNLDRLINTMSAFVEKVSSHEGAELPDDTENLTGAEKPTTQTNATEPESGMSLDVDKLLRILSQPLTGTTDTHVSELDSKQFGGKAAPECDNDDDKEDEEEDFDEDDVGTSHQAISSRQWQQSQDLEANTTSSELFAVMEQMDQELQRAGVGAEFERYPSGHADQTDGRPSVDQKAEQSPGSSTRPTDNAAEELSPVNVDLNLVKNLLASYHAQQGMAGPVSNLLGSLGISLPDNQDELPPQ